MTTVTDVTREAGWRTGEISAGPLVTTDGGHLHCSVHVNNDTHNGAESVSADFSAIGGVLVASGPSLVNFLATEADDVSLCSEWDGANGTLYWVAGNPATGDTGRWSYDPSSSCSAGGYVCVVWSDGSICVWY